VKQVRDFVRLIYNEAEKMLKKRRFMVIILILLVLIPMFVYAQYRQSEKREERLGTSDWKISLQQQITDSQNRLNSSGIPDEWRSWLKVQVEQQQYYLAHNINPNTPGAPTFTRSFLEQSIGLFLPLLIMVIAID
jgi:ABC-2 type transport system permease protein